MNRYIDIMFLYFGLYAILHGLGNIIYELLTNTTGNYYVLAVLFIMVSISVVYFLIRFILHTS